MNQLKTGWNVPKLHQLFDQDSIKAIIKIPMWNSSQTERWAWVSSVNGQIFKENSIQSNSGE